MPKKRDAVIILAVVAVAALLLAVSRLMPRTSLEGKTAQETLAPDAVEYLDGTPEPEATDEPEATPGPEATDEPEATEEPEATAELEATDEPEVTAEPEADKPQSAAVGPMPPRQTQEVAGHVILTVNGRQYGDPIPMDRDKIITLAQDDGKVNKVHITPDKVYMESSTCDNQDCVQQGEITLDNYETRILSTYVICLPNNVTVEMVPAGQ